MIQKVAGLLDARCLGTAVGDAASSVFRWELRRQMQSRDTIAAMSSGQLPAGVAVVRISGPRTRDVIATLAGSLPPARHARYGTLRLADGTELDAGLTLFFPGPNSFTGEDCGELQVHGGRAVIDALLGGICALDGCRLAEAGEFTRRAYLNGKMSLLDSESTADLITAETEAQRRFAVSNSHGGNAALYAEWRARLVRARAWIEAELDFSDEGDIPGSVSDQVWLDMANLASEIAAHTAGYSKAEMLRDGFDVVLLGAPNSGKSSLLNALAKREAAIVTEEPGTTRDLIEVVLNLNGFKVRVTDTAGIRHATGRVEQIGIERGLLRAEEAGLVLMLSDMSNPSRTDAFTGSFANQLSTPTLSVGTKSDLVDSEAEHSDFDFEVSSITRNGLSALVDEIARRAAIAAPRTGELVPWRVRHVELLNQAEDSLKQAVSSNDPLELRSEYLRLASSALGRITGDVDVEELLDVIFGQFCIGK
jgi:tRNA modification GTPase